MACAGSRQVPSRPGPQTHGSCDRHHHQAHRHAPPAAAGSEPCRLSEEARQVRDQTCSLSWAPIYQLTIANIKNRLSSDTVSEPPWPQPATQALSPVTVHLVSTPGEIS